ncbi:MAG: patatin family protein [Desulfovibrio sp.]
MDSETILILEGGGLRGVYTTGVLRLFMDQKLFIPNVFGVSMGACNAANYISRQIERNEIVNVEFVNDPRYLSYARLFLGGDLFGMRFIFDEVPNRLVPFDYDTFLQNPARFWTVTTDCATGRPVYHEKSGWDRTDTMRLLQAACSLPVLARPVPWDGLDGHERLLMDGGIADPVPLHKCRELGHTRFVLVLTQPRGYRKRPTRGLWAVRLRHPRLTGLHKALAVRHERYNALMDEIDALEARGEIFVIRPSSGLGVGRVERNKEILRAVIRRGHADARERLGELARYLD